MLFQVVRGENHLQIFIDELLFCSIDPANLDHSVCSVSYLEKQFLPANRTQHSARRFFGRFAYTLRLSNSSIHRWHAHFDFALAQMNMANGFATKHEKYCFYINQDDKNKIPFGEPGRQVVGAHTCRPGSPNGIWFLSSWLM